MAPVPDDPSKLPKGWRLGKNGRLVPVLRIRKTDNRGIRVYDPSRHKKASRLFKETDEPPVSIRALNWGMDFLPPPGNWETRTKSEQSANATFPYESNAVARPQGRSNLVHAERASNFASAPPALPLQVQLDVRTEVAVPKARDDSEQKRLQAMEARQQEIVAMKRTNEEAMLVREESFILVARAQCF